MAHRTVGAGGVAVIVGVDLLFLRSQPWLRLATNIGIVLLSGAFYVRFVAKRCRPNDERRTDATSPLAAGTVRRTGVPRLVAYLRREPLLETREQTRAVCPPDRRARLRRLPAGTVRRGARSAPSRASSSAYAFSACHRPSLACANATLRRRGSHRRGVPRVRSE
jgi:hypothetical protein